MATVRQLLIGLLSSSVLYSGLVPALGLGDITLRSALSQPLDAEIELLDVGDLTDADMRVRLAPADVFSRSAVLASSVCLFLVSCVSPRNLAAVKKWCVWCRPKRCVSHT